MNNDDRESTPAEERTFASHPGGEKCTDFVENSRIAKGRYRPSHARLYSLQKFDDEHQTHALVRAPWAPEQALSVSIGGPVTAPVRKPAIVHIKALSETALDTPGKPGVLIGSGLRHCPSSSQNPVLISAAAPAGDKPPALTIGPATDIADTGTLREHARSVIDLNPFRSPEPGSDAPAGVRLITLSKEAQMYLSPDSPVIVFGRDGQRISPTTEVRARELTRKGRAAWVIYGIGLVGIQMVARRSARKILPALKEHARTKAKATAKSAKPTAKSGGHRKTSPLILKLRQRDGDQCFYCMKTLSLDEMNVDQLFRSKTGKRKELKYLALAHAECTKGTGDLSIMEKIKIRGNALFASILRELNAEAKAKAKAALSPQ